MFLAPLAQETAGFEQKRPEFWFFADRNRFYDTWGDPEIRGFFSWFTYIFSGAGTNPRLPSISAPVLSSTSSMRAWSPQNHQISKIFGFQGEESWFSIEESSLHTYRRISNYLATAAVEHRHTQRFMSRAHFVGCNLRRLLLLRLLLLLRVVRGADVVRRCWHPHT